MKYVMILMAFIIKLYSNEFELIPRDDLIKYRFELPENTYHRFCKNIYSQNGEDGLLEHILKELEIHDGSFCEFGASDGVTSSNTCNLIMNHNFSGILIESDRSLYDKCSEYYKPYSNVRVYHGMVDYKDSNFNLNAWLRKGGLEIDFDVLSIDIDCDDYYVWDNLSEYQPKIVIFEVNSYRDPVFDELPRNLSYQYNVDPLERSYPSRRALGCSFISGVKLGLRKGYIPVAFSGNLTFVRKDLIHKLKEFPYILSENPYDYIPLYTHLVMWNNEWFTNLLLILNKSIGDYFLKFNKFHIDIPWLNERMTEILNETEVAPIGQMP